MTSSRPPCALANPGRAWACAAVVNGVLAVLLACLWVWLGVQGLFWRADFSAFYTGWRIVLDGRGEQLYDLDLQADYQRRILPERPPGEGLLPFVNPPHAALPLAPLALLPRPLAFTLWTVAQVGLCVLAARFLLRLQADQPPLVRWLTLLAALAFPPLFSTFQMGQVSLWCLVCLLGFVCALKERRPLAVAVWLVAGTIKPQLVVVPLLVLLGQRRWRELALATGLLAAWAGITAVVLGPGCWTGFVSVLRFSSEQSGTSGVDPLVMYNLKGLLTALRTVGALPDWPGVNVLTAVAWLAAGGLTVWLWRDRGALDAPGWQGRLALTFLLGTLVNPHLNPHDALVLVLPAVLFHAHLCRTARQWQATAFATIALACPLLFLLDCYGVDPGRLGFRPFFLLLVGLAGWMALWLRRDALPAARPA
jgi:hypothetical protein